MLQIDLGCGTNKREGFLGVDMWPANEPDILSDIRTRIVELESGCADYVLCSHVLEHLGVEEWRQVLQEIGRLLMPTGKFELRMPHPSHDDSMIHGHIHVMTPHFWRSVRDQGWTAKDGLVIERIEEVPNPACLEFCRNSVDFELWAPFLRNAYRETVVKGVKQ